jgi:hypothetical protein
MIRVAVVLAMLVAARAGAAPVTQCKAGKGAPIFEARWISGKARIVTKVFESGMWTRLATGFTTQHSKSGCIEKATLDEIKASLKTVKWKKTKAQEPCYGAEANPVAFYAGGQKRHTRKTCGGMEIDEASAKLIERIERLIPDRFEPPVIIEYEEI